VSRGNGWRWAFVPRWLLDSEAFLRLESTHADLLFRLYLTCDAHGRFQAGPHALMRITGMFSKTIETDVHALTPTFVQLYEVSGVKYGQIQGYDEDAPGELLRKRGTSLAPDPPNVRPTSANRPDDMQTRTAKIDKTKKREMRIDDYPF